MPRLRLSHFIGVGAGLTLPSRRFNRAESHQSLEHSHSRLTRSGAPAAMKVGKDPRTPNLSMEGGWQLTAQLAQFGGDGNLSQ